MFFLILDYTFTIKIFIVFLLKNIYIFSVVTCCTCVEKKTSGEFWPFADGIMLFLKFLRVSVIFYIVNNIFLLVYIFEKRQFVFGKLFTLQPINCFHLKKFTKLFYFSNLYYTLKMTNIKTTLLKINKIIAWGTLYFIFGLMSGIVFYRDQYQYITFFLYACAVFFAIVIFFLFLFVWFSCLGLLLFGLTRNFIGIFLQTNVFKIRKKLNPKYNYGFVLFIDEETILWIIIFLTAFFCFFFMLFCLYIEITDYFATDLYKMTKEKYCLKLKKKKIKIFAFLEKLKTIFILPFVKYFESFQFKKIKIKNKLFKENKKTIIKEIGNKNKKDFTNVFENKKEIPSLIDPDSNIGKKIKRQQKMHGRPLLSVWFDDLIQTHVIKSIIFSLKIFGLTCLNFFEKINWNYIIWKIQYFFATMLYLFFVVLWVFIVYFLYYIKYLTKGISLYDIIYFRQNNTMEYLISINFLHVEKSFFEWILFLLFYITCCILLHFLWNWLSEINPFKVIIKSLIYFFLDFVLYLKNFSRMFFLLVLADLKRIFDHVKSFFFNIKDLINELFNLISNYILIWYKEIKIIFRDKKLRSEYLWNKFLYLHMFFFAIVMFILLLYIFVILLLVLFIDFDILKYPYKFYRAICKIYFYANEPSALEQLIINSTSTKVKPHSLDFYDVTNGLRCHLCGKIGNNCKCCYKTDNLIDKIMNEWMD